MVGDVPVSNHTYTPETAALGIDRAISIFEGRWKLVILFHPFGEIEVVRGGSFPTARAEAWRPLGAKSSLRRKARCRFPSVSFVVSVEAAVLGSPP